MAEELQTGHTPKPDRAVGRAWVALCLAVVLHCIDEGMHDFLSIYNPTVVELRARLPWYPAPTFTYQNWAAGLIAGLALLLALSPFVYRGLHWARAMAWIFAVLMLVNAVLHVGATILGHTVQSVRVAGPMPGVYTSPLMFIAAIYLLYTLWVSRQLHPIFHHHATAQ